MDLLRLLKTVKMVSETGGYVTMATVESLKAASDFQKSMDLLTKSAGNCSPEYPKMEDEEKEKR